MNNDFDYDSHKPEEQGSQLEDFTSEIVEFEELEAPELDITQEAIDI